ncbi:reverse transcriptase family protein [Leclercia sp. Marseille-Q4284]|uniref:reverse transcriptase family protein n=1 Tax=Leclercia sp. Marseille-Q4284 TaxID=2866582 RepID=UPI001CE47E56|nr:reverse transcriptase family protein [Leclercia sp. Marseille-Q4284]
MPKDFSFKDTFTPIQKKESLIALLGIKDVEKFNNLVRDGVERSYYVKPPIKKKNGGERIVYAPNRMLKTILRKINNKIFNQINYPNYLYGSIPDKENPRDYILCAQQHCKAKILIKIDIENFFPTMKAKFVFKLFKEVFKFSDEVSDILTKLTTYDGFVPQGAPTSTYLANLYFHDCEPNKVSYLRSLGFRYTRLIDDITISRLEKEGDWKFVEGIISDFIKQKELTINDKKTKLLSTHSTQSFKVHGLCIEESSPRFTKNERLVIKTQVNRIVKTGYGNDKIRMDKNYHNSYFSVKGKTTKLKRVNCPDYPVLKKLLSRHCDPLPEHKEIKRINRVISNLSKDYAVCGNTERYLRRYFQVIFRIEILKKLYPVEANEFKLRLKLISPIKNEN